jgi:hypothetical protein
MRFRGTAWLALMLSLVAADAYAQKTLAFLATVSPAGKEIADVTADDVQVTENGQRLKVSKVEIIERTPKLQLLIDNGVGFPSSNLGDLRNGIKAFLNSLPNELEVTIVTTAPNPRMLQAATTDKVKLLSAIDRLVPDQGSGRFTDSLFEATERIEKDKDEKAAYSIVTIGTTQGDLTVRDDFIKKIGERVQKRSIPVYVILFSTLRGSTTGGVQQDLGTAAAAMGGGRIEVLNAPTRLVSLLPELGEYLSTTMKAGKQMSVIIDRPNGGALGEIGMQILGANVHAMALDASRTR